MPQRARAPVACCLLLLAAVPAWAAEWKHELAPYLWGSAMEGTVGIGDVTAETEMSFSDILDDLEFGFMGTYRATRDRYSITVDAIYMGLGATEEGPAGVLKADIDLDQVGLEADLGYALNDRFTLLGGLRYVSLDADLRVTGPLGNELSASEGQDWVDPVVGAIYAWPFAEEWALNLRGDIGGFGIGSDFAWQGVATLRWQFSPRTALAIAYRYLDMDYEDGKGSNYFKYDVATSGPAMGVVFTF
jgi:opacity protein-like surface antigen